MPKNHIVTAPKNQYQGTGYVLWPIVVGSLVIVVGAIGILARSSGGQFGSLFSVEAKEAKDAAESGIEEVIASMNSPENRGTLVASWDPSKWWAGETPSNPCAPTSTSSPLSNLKKYYQDTGLASNVVAGSSPTSSDAKHFYLLKILIKSPAGTSIYERNSGKIPTAPTTSGAWALSSSSSAPIDHAGSINLLNSTNTGLISITAVGYSRRPDGTYVKSIVTKEYEIVPKCCGRTFGKTFPVSGTPTLTHGFDSRDCRSGGDGLGELGFIIGVNGNGKVTKAAGKSLQMFESNSEGDLVASDQILTQNQSIDCSLAANIDQCQLTNSALLDGKTLITSYPIKLDPLPASPDTKAKGCIKGDLILNTSDGNDMEGLSPSDSQSYCLGSEIVNPGIQENGYVDAGAPKGKKGSEECTGAGTQYLGLAVPKPYDYIIDSNGTEIGSPAADRCYTASSRKSSTTNYDYCIDNFLLGTVDCSIGYISLSSGSLKIDTSGKKVRLFLYDTAFAGVGGVSGGEIKLTGNGTIEHIYKGSPAGLAQSDRLSIYGNLQNQLFSFGGTSISLAAQIYLPYGTLAIGGTTTLNGILWTNNLSLNGNLTINTPPASAICKVITGCDPADPNKNPIAWDWIARSPNATSLFN